MAKSGRGYQGRATKLHALLVIEMRRKCERCGKQPPEPECGHLVTRKKCPTCMERRKRNTFQCAHIVSRAMTKVRTNLENAYCFCGGCHLYTTRWPVEFARFIYKRSGKAKYNELKELAETKGAKFDWKAEYFRLDAIAQQMGIEHEFGPPPSKAKAKRKTAAREGRARNKAIKAQRAGRRRRRG